MGETIQFPKGKIYQAIVNTMKDIGVVGKNDNNDYDHYKFRGIDAVMNALNPAMIKNGIFVVPTVLDCTREERQGKSSTMMYTVLKVNYRFFSDDGSYVDSVVIGEAMDRSDKSTNKAMSAAFKYACFQTFCIPTEEMIDSEPESPEIGQKTSKEKKDSRSDEEKNKEMVDSVDAVYLPTEDGKVTDAQMEKLKSELERTGLSDSVILSGYGIKKLEDMNQAQVISALNRFQKTPDKKVEK